jgi:hypothetical protein
MLTLRIRNSTALAAVIVALSLFPGPGRAAQTLMVTLDGTSTSLTQSTKYHCHDLIAGQLTCYRSASRRDADVTRLLEHRRANALGATATGYVIAYAGISYTVSSVVLTQNYANLATIGWDNVISSYKVFTNLTGAFYSNTYYAGLTQYYCCFRDVPYVGDGYNDTFSSFRLP